MSSPDKPPRSAESMREACALAVEQFDRAGREWVPGSLWDTIAKEMAARIRAIPVEVEVDDPFGGPYPTGDYFTDEISAEQHRATDASPSTGALAHAERSAGLGTDR